MPLYDPLASRFANAPLAPWQVTKKRFDFDAGFVKWIQKYLQTLKLPAEVVNAKAWINKAKFGDGERYELATLQWEAYQESIAIAQSKPVLRDVAADGVGDHSSQSADDRDELEVVPELPDEFARLEGETGAEYAKRMMEISRAKIKNIGSW